MVKSSELRLGNVVQDEHGITMYVYRIQQTGAECCGEKDGGDDLDYQEQEMFGVPLSPEILEKCGFEFVQDSGYWLSYRTSNGFWVSQWNWDTLVAGWEKEGSWYYGDNYQEIKSLHQLQNLYFALAGEELTVNL